MSSIRTGNWSGFTAMLANIPNAINQNTEEALKKIAYRVARSMVTGITSKRFNLKPNAQATIDQKGSSTPLIDKGDLVGSIHVHKIPNGYLSGAHRTATTEDGKSVANIFAMHTFGFSYYDDGGKRIIVPQRDAVTPALKENQQLFLDTFRNALFRSVGIPR